MFVGVIFSAGKGNYVEDQAKHFEPAYCHRISPMCNDGSSPVC